jgi:hypothetical protein
MAYDLTFEEYAAALKRANVPIDINSERVQAFKRFMDDPTLTENPTITPEDRAMAVKYAGQTFTFRARCEGKMREVTLRYSLTPEWIPSFDERICYMFSSNSWNYSVAGCWGSSVRAKTPEDAIKVAKNAIADYEYKYNHS